MVLTPMGVGTIAIFYRNIAALCCPWPTSLVSSVCGIKDPHVTCAVEHGPPLLGGCLGGNYPVYNIHYSHSYQGGCSPNSPIHYYNV